MVKKQIDRHSKKNKEKTNNLSGKQIQSERTKEKKTEGGRRKRKLNICIGFFCFQHRQNTEKGKNHQEEKTKKKNHASVYEAPDAFALSLFSSDLRSSSLSISAASSISCSLPVASFSTLALKRGTRAPFRKIEGSVRLRFLFSFSISLGRQGQWKESEARRAKEKRDLPSEPTTGDHNGNRRFLHKVVRHGAQDRSFDS